MQNQGVVDENLFDIDVTIDTESEGHLSIGTDDDCQIIDVCGSNTDQRPLSNTTVAMTEGMQQNTDEEHVADDQQHFSNGNVHVDPEYVPDPYTGKRLQISCLPLRYEASDLRALFEHFGTILDAVIVCNEWGNSQGSGYVTMADAGEAEQARRALNGLKVDAQQITVKQVSAYQSPMNLTIDCDPEPMMQVFPWQVITPPPAAADDRQQSDAEIESRNLATIWGNAVLTGTDASIPNSFPSDLLMVQPPASALIPIPVGAPSNHQSDYQTMPQQQQPFSFEQHLEQASRDIELQNQQRQQQAQAMGPQFQDLMLHQEQIRQQQQHQQQQLQQASVRPMQRAVAVVRPISNSYFSGNRFSEPLYPHIQPNNFHDNNLYPPRYPVYTTHQVRNHLLSLLYAPNFFPQPIFVAVFGNHYMDSNHGNYWTSMNNPHYMPY